MISSVEFNPFMTLLNYYWEYINLLISVFTI